MPNIKLPARVVKLIASRVGSLFDKIKSQFLGRPGKSMFFSYDKDKSLAGLYEAASRHGGGSPDISDLEHLTDTSDRYLEALKLKTINKVVDDLNNHLSTGQATSATIHEKLQESWKDVTSQLKRIIETESNGAHNVAALNGIMKVNAAIKNEDPYVYFICVKDSALCKECRRLHLLADGITPRVWRLSEVSHGYHKRGNDYPSIWDLHPNGRCVIDTILPGFGFKGGAVSYKGKNYDVLKDQRGE